LHSNTLSLLNEKNQKFDLEGGEKTFNLFFKTYDYIFNINFDYKSGDILRGKETYVDFIIALFFILVISGISASFFFRNKILAPIYGLNKGMEEVEKGNLSPLKRVPSEIELRSLYEGFNSMVQGIKEQKKNISEISRMKTLLKLGRRVAHEVKNPLTPIKLSAEQIQKSLKDKRRDYEKIIKKSVQFIIDEAEHLKKVSYGFLDFSRLDEINAEEFNILNIIREEISSFISLYPNVTFNLTSDGETFTVVLDKLKIKQVVKNILINSIEAIGDKSGEVRFYLKEKGDRIVLEITDNGVGLDSQELDLIFNEDYSTKEIGTGLGLFIVKRIIDLHQGKIEIKSEKNQGTTVILNLPKNV
jgi:nitrogen fixation/metabolism regulation signal transduction histidine kinase